MCSGSLFEDDDVTSHDLTVDANPIQKKEKKKKRKKCTTGDIFRMTLSKGRISTCVCVCVCACACARARASARARAREIMIFSFYSFTLILSI